MHRNAWPSAYTVTMNMPIHSLKTAQALHQAGHLPEAKQAYLALIEQGDNVVEALHHLGLLYAEEGKLNEARQCLERAMAIAPETLALYLHLANVYKAQGAYQQAVQALLKAIKASPRCTAAFNNLGTVYYAQGRFQDAVNAYHSAIALQPSYIDAYFNLGLSLAKLHQHQQAMDAFLAVIELSPKHVGAHFHMGCLLMQQREFRLALDYFWAIARDCPFHFETQANMATCYLKLGQLDDAKSHYQQALALKAEDVSIVFNLGVIFMQQGSPEQAIAYYLRACELRAQDPHDQERPSFFELHNNLGVAYLSLRNWQKALAHFQEALRIEPQNEAIRHTIKILTQREDLASVPLPYVQSLFDSYADHYDEHLLQHLHYHVPQALFQAVQQSVNVGPFKWDVLDLGCGTGLCGEAFRPIARSLTGTDISRNMLAMAAKKNIYDSLEQTEAIAFLGKTMHKYDLVVAGDVIVYMGNLGALFQAVDGVLKDNGHWVFNAEISYDKEYQMNVTGRFAHRNSYIDALADRYNMKIVYYQERDMRTQGQEVVKGHVYLLQKSNVISAP